MKLLYFRQETEKEGTIMSTITCNMEKTAYGQIKKQKAPGRFYSQIRRFKTWLTEVNQKHPALFMAVSCVAGPVLVLLAVATATLAMAIPVLFITGWL